MSGDFDSSLELDDIPKPGQERAQVGNYEILGLLGRGGMGVVYRARQVGLGRVVALKLVTAGSHAGTEAIRRFRNEAQAAARLQHPNIVQVHEVGDHEGQPFFSMEFVDGPTLQAVASAGPVPARTAALYLAEIAGAIDYAHGQGVLHRDLKPSNILLDANGRPRVTDFGLATEISGDSSLTATGSVLGTPAYLPPEQASARRGESGPRSDVYSLGAILYFLMTGRPPFVADSLAENLRQVVEEEPIPPRRLNPSLSRDLETVCLKCLQKSPAGRYDSAKSLAEDLRLWLENRPVFARPVGPWMRSARWARRHPARAAVLALAIASVGLVLGFVTQSRVSALEQRRAAQEALRSVDQGRLTRLQIAETRQTKGDARPLLLTLAEIIRMARTNAGEWALPSTRISVERLLGILSQRTYLVPEVESVSMATTALSIDPSGTRIALGSHLNGLHFFDASSLRETRPPIPHRSEIRRIEWSADREYLLTHDRERVSRLWRSREGAEPVLIIAHSNLVEHAVFDRRGERFLEVEKGEFSVREYPSGNVLFREASTAEVLSAEFGPGTNSVIVVTRTGTAEQVFWEPGGSRNSRSIVELRGPLSSAAVSPDRLRIAVALGRQVHVVPVISGSFASLELEHDTSVDNLAWSPDGERLAAATEGFLAPSKNAVFVWNAQTGRRIAGGMIHRESINQIAFSPNGLWILSASVDRSARLWDAETGRALTEELAHSTSVVGVGFGRDGREILTFTGSEIVSWPIRNGTYGEFAFRVEKPIRRARLSPAGQEILVTFRSGEASRSRFGAVGPTFQNLRLETAIDEARYGPGTNRIIAAAKDGRLLWIPAEDGNGAIEGDGSWGPLLDWDFSASRDVMVSLHRIGPVRIWDLSTTIAKRIELEVTEAPMAVRVSPDGRVVAIVSRGGSVKLYDSRTGRSLGERIAGVPPSWVPTGRSSVARSLTWAKAGLMSVRERSHGAGVDLLGLSAGIPHEQASNLTRVLSRLTTDVENSETNGDGDLGEVFSKAFRSETVPWSWDCRFSPDSTKIASGTAWGTVLIWKVESPDGRPTRPIVEWNHGSNPIALEFCADGDLVASGAQDGTAKIWSQAEGRMIAEIVAHDAGVRGLAFSGDGVRLVTWAFDGEARVWHSRSGLPLSDPLRTGDIVEWAEFAADGNRLLVQSGGRLWGWDTPVAPESVPNWLPRIAELVAGQSTSASRGQPLTPGEWRDFAVQRRLRANRTNFVEGWAAWLFSTGPDRPTSFWNSEPAASWVRRLIQSKDEATLRRAVFLDPGGAVGHARLAQALVSGSYSNDSTRWKRALWLARHARELAPQDEEVRAVEETVTRRVLTPPPNGDRPPRQETSE